MSWEYLCTDCGKSVFLDWDARGCKILCDECKALDEEDERKKALAVDHSIDVDIDHAEHGMEGL